jgi:hypothetical protein
MWVHTLVVKVCNKYSHVYILLFKHILEFLYWEKNSCGYGSTSSQRRVWIKNASLFLTTHMKVFAPTNKDLEHLGFIVLPRSSIYLKFCMDSTPCLFLITWHTPSWFFPCMLMTRVSHSTASCYGVFKMKTPRMQIHLWIM